MPYQIGGTAWTFIIGVVLFLFVGLPLVGAGVYLGGLFIFVGLVMILGAFIQNNENEKKKGQARRIAQQMAQMYPQGFYPPQQIIINTPPPAPTSTHTEISRETIVKVRCKHCNSLNFETASRCTQCGANL